ncbi:hypothetical protein [Vibrio sp. HN007]|uniref:hypothetical protein n=1 Tax=Vibrio iocasae TaxID=3098914 RepID=UPI0035D3F8C3
MKLIITILLLLIPFSTFARCDEENARNAVSEEISLRGASRKIILEIRDFDEKYYYKRTPLSKVFEAPEQLACSMKRSVVMDIAASTSMNIIEDCEEKIKEWRQDAQSFNQDGQKMFSVWEEVYDQCSNVRDKDLRGKVRLYYDQRDSYKWTMDHILNKRIAPLEKKCQEEKKYLQDAIAIKDTQNCG